jgi:hypothetical protein
MPFRTEKFVTRDMLRDQPQTLFVFGDNMVHQGRGGQAAEMRGEPNAVGIPTKWRPSMHEGAFFCDRDYSVVHHVIWPLFERLAKHLKDGGDVVWPADGIGTGKAELRERAPSIMNLIESLRSALEHGRRL